MTRAIVRFYAADFSREVFEECVRGGVIVGASGTLNLLWEDFSALEVAGGLGLQDVTWAAVKDSSPGDLMLTVHYAALTVAQVEARLGGQDWIEGYAFQPPLTLSCYG